jgi:transglutaminase-like putative cysteine protease
MRTLVAIAVLGLWVAVLGQHVRREYMQPELARLAEAALALGPGTTFYTLRMGDRAVGQANSRLDTLPDGFRLDDQMILELTALGQPGTAVARTQVDLDRALTMRTFSFSLDSEVGRFQATGRVRGDTLLEVTVTSAGSEEQISFRLASPPVFSAVLPIRIALGEGLEVGKRVRLPVFDPSTLSTRTVEVRILEHDTLVVADSVALDAEGRWQAVGYDSVPAWRIAQVFGGMALESWIDDDGRVLRASSPLGFSMERTEFELARQAIEEARGLEVRSVDEDVILATAIQSDVSLGDLDALDELRFVLRGVDLEGFDLDGGRQRLHGDTLVVRRERWGELDPSYTLPYPRMDLREALEAEPLVQSDHPRIVETARSIAFGPWSGRNADPREVALRLNQGVYDRLDKVITLSVPSALQVLESGQGDCNEHTVLYVALARALGLPARTAVGLVWVEGTFYYHAWPEVWLGEWVAVDPPFGQTPADAAHIRFIVGGLAQQVEVIRLIGRLDIEILADPARGVGP